MPEYPSYVTKELLFDTVIKKGDTGAKARRVQEWLSIHSFATVIDSIFGDATEKCVKDFQQTKGIQVTGNVNQQTWDALVGPLSKALQPINLSANTSLAGAILLVAKQHLAQRPIEVGGDNSGPWVRVYVGGNQGPEWRWCAGFVTFVMKQACMLLDCPMPIPGSYSCDSLAYQAKQAGLFIKGAQIVNGNIPWPTLGAAQIFLVRKTSTDWVHTGFSFEGSGQVFSTIEGNTNDDGSNNGYEVCKRTRSTLGKDFIHF
ncbi:MAG TPA: peptidoglycan-binding domain-containing protein [Blastocatellia bacterium]|nr:peptidoglycan-binding domain-containing protein [Blastocatellia bacterium]HMX26441.1 peptidoglycan-binding domain-containing protein [Blastocatellia bacterium]HMZ21185.1 peptidoglycan-binding domain-containing protein [Blastocatellia bacterium]HNG28504.1 peptidoglycan-binding domain-containing protein [Blastocatellia bacterium]